MSKTTKSKDPLTRTPDSWARDWGWVSRRRAVNAAAKIRAIADLVGDDENSEAAQEYARDLRQIASSLAPTKVPAVLKRERRERAEAVR